MQFISHTRITPFLDLIRFSRPVGTYLVMFPALWSLFLAGNGHPPIKLIIIFTLGSFIMRSAGCAINDLADREIDGNVERTKGRPLVSGRLAVTEAIVFFSLLVGIAFLLALMLNRLAFYLSFVGLFLAVTYPFMKRFIHVPQAYMGMAFGWGAVIAWAAVRGTVELPAILIFIATLLWAAAYDTIYAFQDIEDDEKIGVKSSALFLGRYALPVVGVMYAATLSLLIYIGILTERGWLYAVALLLVTFIFIHQIWSVKKSPDRETASRAFKSNVRIGAIILTAIVVENLFSR